MRRDPSQAQKERILKKNAGVCCVCKQRWLGVNFHHIDGDNSNTIDENLAVLCLKDHDAHHRPGAYLGFNHLELKAEQIKEFKNSWENFVAEASKSDPEIFAVINVYGSEINIHSIRLIFQWSDGRIVFERIYHLMDGPIES